MRRLGVGSLAARRRAGFVVRMAAQRWQARMPRRREAAGDQHARAVEVAVGIGRRRRFGARRARVVLGDAVPQRDPRDLALGQLRADRRDLVVAVAPVAGDRRRRALGERFLEMSAERVDVRSLPTRGHVLSLHPFATNVAPVLRGRVRHRSFAALVAPSRPPVIGLSLRTRSGD